MSDLIGNVAVPDPVVIGTAFPIVSDFPHGRARRPKYYLHRFGSGNAKIEQVFLAGNGSVEFTIQRANLTDTEYASLRDFWEEAGGCEAQFAYHAPDDDGVSTTDYVCWFKDQSISFDRLVDGLSTASVTLVGVPASSPTYTLNSTVTRFPGSSLQTALLARVQRMIPLVKIQPREVGYPATYISDRRCTVGGQLYIPRLLDWDGIGQALGNEADNARFAFGNADGTMSDFSADTMLVSSDIEFSLFHVGTGIKIDLWKGEIIDFVDDDSNPVFQVVAADNISQLTFSYPNVNISRQCWKDYKSLACGATSPLETCDKSFENCVARANEQRFGGIVANPQMVFLKQIGGILRRRQNSITSVSMISDTIYGSPLKEIYTDSAMEVACDIAAGREESEFYDALGIVGRGPLGAYGTGHTLDGQLHHGPGEKGLRKSLGADPNPDPFALGSGSGGSYTYGPERAGGTAFLEFRRNDEKGQQLSRLQDHAMKAVVAQGLSGFKWTAPGSRTTGVLTNPAWIAINMLIRAKGLELAPVEDQEELFDVPAAVATAAIYDLSADKLVGSGSETQFKFRGVIQEKKPLRDWLQEVLMNGLGYFTNSFGKLRIGTRINSSVVEVFNEGNIIFNSLSRRPVRPSFNHLTASFADEEYNYAGNTMQIYDVDHAKLIGRGSVQYTTGDINLSGSPSKSQAARIASVRLREELGGVTYDEQKKARMIRFRTTVLALNTEVGQVCSMVHPRMPSGAGEFRITSWRLNSDFSIDIEGRTTTDSMYDLTVGPKPADVTSAAPAIEYYQTPDGPVWHPNIDSPNVDDPVLGPDDNNFGIAQDYTVLLDGNPKATLIITGEQPVTRYADGVRPPTVTSISKAAAGSSLAAGPYYIAVCAQMANGQFSPPSNILSIDIVDGDSITMNGLKWPAGTFTGYVIFAAKDDERLLCAQTEVTAALPTSITWSGHWKRSTWGMPNRKMSKVRVKGKPLIHAGVDGVRVTAVSAGVMTSSDMIGAGDDWNGRIVSVISDLSDGSATLWNFEVTAYNTATGAFTCTPDPAAAGVQIGDALIVRAKAESAGSDWVEDSKWVSGHYPTGLVNREGCIVRVLYGKGRGQARIIKTHTTTRMYIDRPWEVLPDTTSIIVVEDGGWPYFAESTAISNAVRGVQMQMQMRADNLLNAAILVCSVGVDENGVESPEDTLSAIREIWMYGRAPGMKTITSDYTISRDDKTILVDTTANPVTVTLLPGADMIGLPLVIKLITNGSTDDPPGNDCTIMPASGQDVDGAVSIILDHKGQSL